MNNHYHWSIDSLIAQNFYRPTDKDVAKKYANQFSLLALINIGGWHKARKK